MRHQKLSPSSNVKSAAPDLSEYQVEAARYAVLRRLAPCLRHHMVRPLQPIGLIYGLMQHKLSAVEPDWISVRQEADKINEFAKAALVECVDMGTWLAPEPGILTEISAGVRECVGLLATMLHFGGFHLENEVEPLPVQVRQDALRMLLSAALLALTDAMTRPATLTLRAAASKVEVTLSLQISQYGEGGVERYEDGYRKLAWRDVEALAAAENVALSREEDQISMGFAIEHAAQAPIH